PEELWLEVLTNLTLDDIRSLFATTTSFNRLARPFVFACFVFVPFWSEVDPSVVEAAHKAGMERLACWFSEPAASLVRSGYVAQADPEFVNFVNDEEGHSDPVRLESTAAVRTSTDILFNHVIENLGRFSGLKLLHMRVMTLSSTAITQIHRLAVLEELNIRFKSITGLDENDFIGRHPLGLSKLTIHENRTPEGLPRFGNFWSSFMHPLHLHTLDINISGVWWSQAPEDVPVFANVTTLTLFWAQDVPHPNFAANLKKFRAVLDFGLQPRDDYRQRGGFDSIPDTLRHALLEGLQSVLPSLTHLRSLAADGVFGLLLPYAPVLAYLQTCTHFSSSTARLLGSLAESKTVKYVALGLIVHDIVSFVQIGQFFPNLEQLRVSVDFWVGQDAGLGIESELWVAISGPSPLPNTLKVLLFDVWLLRGDVSDELPYPTSAVNVEQVARLRDAIITRFPALTRLRLKGNGFLIFWRKDGEDRIIVDPADLGRDEDYIDELWEIQDH
ncbi:hypothetical protein C8F01DRAFT_1138096, partial [Mycena amicta]